MQLRGWQSACISAAISKYQNLKKHFLALATPGSGKTLMASVLAKRLYDLDKIDLVLCFSPSSIVAHDFRCALIEQFEMHFDGTIGSIGNSYTYQSLNTLDEKIWRLFDRYRVFVIFDEIHHCAGSNLQDTNCWGEPIVLKIKDRASCTIALTGTPWRSDSLPIVLAEYCNTSRQIQCDYIYGLKAAIRDNVCRLPKVIALDNDQITVVEGNERSHFTSFIDLLNGSIISYTEIVTNDSVIEQLVSHANVKLNELRKINPSAGGLIVAASISHAWQIQLILMKINGETAIVITSDEDDPTELIQSYRLNQDKWVISVGMISEGTNIPRLQVCCYLSNVKTEMYFRQVLGRILRITSSPNQEALLFMPAETKLIDIAFRLAQDIPDRLSPVKFIKMNKKLVVEDSSQVIGEPTELNNSQHEIEFNSEQETNKPIADIEYGDRNAASFNESIMNIFGQFNHTELEIDGFELSEQSIEKLTYYNDKVF